MINYASLDDGKSLFHRHCRRSEGNLWTPDLYTILSSGSHPAAVFSQSYVQSSYFAMVYTVFFVVFCTSFQRDPNDPTSVVTSSSVSRKLLLTTEQKQIQAILKHIQLLFFCSITFRSDPGLVGDGTQLRKLMNLVFLWAEDGTQLNVDLPIVYKAEDVCLGLKKDIGDRVSMHDIPIHPNLKLLSKNENIPVRKIMATDTGNIEHAWYKLDPFWNV
ncbi:hypothetical protein Sango_1591700 [Sesamum angolense]|uniref:Uncharacterized protein n=1 Tax=Sesamum angolense TaxID=2727404 RepID=A0AAE2BTU0_9LAMI|nr:hypothetical protein Sango_1591700 [Sesamum angolense]